MMQEESLNETTKFQELGTALRNRREGRGLELEDIALRIKISAKNLQAIEAGSQEGLPQPVFTRGFIRSYAQMLEMDLAEVERLLREAFPEVLVNNINADLTTGAREQSVGINSPVIPKKFFAILGILLLLGAIGAGAWLYLGGLDKLTGFPASETPSGVRAVDNGNTPPAAVETGSDQPAGSAEAAPAQGSGDATAGDQAAPPVQAQPGEQPSQPDAQAAAPVPQPESAQTAVSRTVVRTGDSQPAGHQVQLRVVAGRSWIGIQADDSIFRNFELRSGGSYLLKFRQKATITIGNAAAVQATYNGQRVPFTGREGEVKILRFQPAG